MHTGRRLSRRPVSNVRSTFPMLDSALTPAARRPCASSRTSAAASLAEARRGGANLQASGELEVEKVLHDVMEDAIGERDVTPAAICLGIAGVDRPDDAADGARDHEAHRLQGARARRQRRARRARGGRARRARGRRDRRHRIHRLRAERRRRGGARRRLGLRARRRGQRVLDRPRGAFARCSGRRTAADSRRC